MLNRISIVKRLIAAFSVLALVGAAIGVVGLVSMSRMDARAQRTYDLDLTGFKYATRAETAVVYSGHALEAAILAPDEKTRAALLADARRYHDDARSNLDRTAPLFAKEQEGRDLSKLATLKFDKYAAAFTDLAGVIEQEKIGDHGRSSTLL